MGFLPWRFQGSGSTQTLQIIGIASNDPKGETDAHLHIGDVFIDTNGDSIHPSYDRTHGYDFAVSPGSWWSFRGEDPLHLDDANYTHSAQNSTLYEIGS